LKKSKNNGGLRWLKQAFFVGVPARNLTAEEADKYGRDWLVNSGLYAPVEIQHDEPEAHEEEQWETMELESSEKSY